MDFELWKRCRDEDTRVIKRVRWRPEGCCQVQKWSGQKQIQITGAGRTVRGQRTWQRWTHIKSGGRDGL